MVELLNWHKAPLVVIDKDGKRHTIAPGESKKVDGDFKNHHYVKIGFLSVDGELVAKDTDTKTELEQLRERYKAIYKKPAPPAAKAESLRQRIEEWQDQEEKEEPQVEQNNQAVAAARAAAGYEKPPQQSQQVQKNNTHRN